MKHSITKKFINLLIVFSLVFISGTITTYSEGSQNLLDSGGDRPYIDYRSTDIVTQIPRKTILYVYAKDGETINLGSSANGIGSGSISHTDPQNNTTQCLTTEGVINNLSEELAGPLPNSGGYTPCVINVSSATEGIWEIEFTSPDPTNLIDPSPISVTDSWSQSSNRSYILAWDVTVRDNNGDEKTGRTYANYIAWNMGRPTAQISSEVFVKTRDSYEYKIDFNGIEPWGFIFFSNNKGVTDLDGNPTRQSLQLEGQNPNFTTPTGFTFHRPFESDTAENVTNKIFFTKPADDLPQSSTLKGQSIWLDGTLPPVAQVSNFQFNGLDGTPNTGGTFDKGGNFTFDSTAAGRYRIDIDVNGDGIYDNNTDKTVEGVGIVGNNSVYWDGLDGNDNPVSASQADIGVRLSYTNGEIHFPFIDVENNNNGIIIERIEPTPSDFSVYYDDSNLSTAFGNPPLPVSSLISPADSQNGARAFSDKFGDGRLIDTWTYQLVQAAELANTITLREADIRISKNHVPGVYEQGSSITYYLDIENSSQSNDSAQGISVIDNFPAGLTNINWSCQITNDQSGDLTNECDDISGTGDIDTTLKLNPGATARFTIVAEVSATNGTTLTNTATVGSGLDSTDNNPNDNESTDVVYIGQQADLQLSKSLAGSLVSGSTAQYNINVENLGPNTSVASFDLKDTLPSELTFNSISNSSTNQGWSCTPNNQIVNCTYSNDLPVNQTTDLEIIVNVE
ncbi:MAG: DUF11 domain-containing protein [Patescibacteria group bacterium]